jgi:class 3 adenylate cyclase
VGACLNRVARLLAAGHGGQILLSETTVRAVEGSLPLGVGVRRLGPHRLQGLPEPVALFQLEASDLRARFPPPRATTRSPADRSTGTARRG